MLLTLAGWLAGFDGEFDFKDIGKDYLEPGVPYVAMRLLPAILGVLTVSLMFLTLKASGCRSSTAVVGASIVIFGKSNSQWYRLTRKLTTSLLQTTRSPLNPASYFSTPPWSFSLL